MDCIIRSEGDLKRIKFVDHIALLAEGGWKAFNDMQKMKMGKAEGEDTRRSSQIVIHPEIRNGRTFHHVSRACHRAVMD